MVKHMNTTKPSWCKSLEDIAFCGQWLIPTANYIECRGCTSRGRLSYVNTLKVKPQ